MYIIGVCVCNTTVDIAINYVFILHIYICASQLPCCCDLRFCTSLLIDQYLGMFHFSASAGLVMPGADSISEALAVQQRREGQVPQPPGDGGPLHPWQPTGMGLFFCPNLGKMGGLFVCQCECRCVWSQRRLTSNQVCVPHRADCQFPHLWQGLSDYKEAVSVLENGE